MKKPAASQTLPENYHQTSEFDLNTNRGLGMMANLLGLGLLFGVGWLFLESLSFLRPAYVSGENILIITGMREFWRGALMLVVSVVLAVLLREGLHGLVLWAITGELPRLSLHRYYAYAEASEWYMPRSGYIWIAFAPVVVITLLGVIAVTMVPLNLVVGVMLLVSLNVAMSVGDIITAIWLLGKPQDVLVAETRDGVKVYHYEEG
ncbi:DUF3267 domain-containing protein [bacterium]|nr:DUF3267 domain-containing protein [bacterium]